jgi:hypothetical protein
VTDGEPAKADQGPVGLLEGTQGGEPVSAVGAGPGCAGLLHPSAAAVVAVLGPPGGALLRRRLAHPMSVIDATPKISWR